MTNKKPFNVPDIFGITKPEVAKEFAQQNEVTLRLGGVARNTARDAYNLLVPGILGGTAGAVGRVAGGTMRGISNIMLGIPWAATQWTAKKVENLGQAPEKLRWKGSDQAA